LAACTDVSLILSHLAT